MEGGHIDENSARLGEHVADYDRIARQQPRLVSLPALLEEHRRIWQTSSRKRMRLLLGCIGVVDVYLWTTKHRTVVAVP